MVVMARRRPQIRTCDAERETADEGIHARANKIFFLLAFVCVQDTCVSVLVRVDSTNFIQECMENRKVQIEFLRLEEQFPYVLTKALGRDKL
jgi:hypothetical protein